MDLGLNEQQEMLKNFARDFLEKECPETLVRQMEEDERGYSPELWKKMADQGWHGLIIPEQYGGAGLEFLDLIVLLEEFGRALVPGPFISTVVHAAYPILLAGSEQQKQQYLPKIASGDLIGCLAYTEPSAQFKPDAISLEAKKSGNGYTLNGTKLFVENANVADIIVVVARTGGSGAQGLSLFVVDAKSPGIEITPLKTIASDKQCEVTFKDVQVPAENLLGAEGQAAATLEQVQQRATVAECAYLVGLAQMDFEISVNYAKERVQFGRPIGSFQAIQHKAADMVTDVDGARFIMYKAAWSVQEGESDADLNVHMAKAWCSDATRRVVAHGQQIHGGIGFTKDYKIQLFFRRQKKAELMWGDGDFHREYVAEALGV
ncbi:MAG TPA: acyl-CoA dehydrogenase family protein [Dehalococcoidia bacterium]|nr:acyl-CoA dehydrogenase family protein [Dehalococcoidia bacterium]